MGDFLLLMVLVGIMFFLTSLVLAAAVKITPEHKRLVVLRLGRFLGVYGPGLSFLIPFLDHAVEVDLGEQVDRIEGAVITTQDDKRVSFDLVWIWRVVDPAKSVLNVRNPESPMREMAVTVLSSQVGSMVRDDVLMSREVLRRQIHARLMEITEPWGVEVRDVDIPYMGRA